LHDGTEERESTNLQNQNQKSNLLINLLSTTSLVRIYYNGPETLNMASDESLKPVLGGHRLEKSQRNIHAAFITGRKIRKSAMRCNTNCYKRSTAVIFLPNKKRSSESMTSLGTVIDSSYGLCSNYCNPQSHECAHRLRLYIAFISL
jgi:hypothetical protein